MVKQAKVLAKATVQLINDLKGQAESQPDSDVQKRLIVAARLLADATAKLVDAAKGCKSNPNDSASQAALTKAAEELREATTQAAVGRSDISQQKATFTTRIEVEERPVVPPPPPPEVLHEVESYKKVQQMQQQMLQQRQQSERTMISESHLEVNYPLRPLDSVYLTFAQNFLIAR